jgi:tritrans,polycis-undecaprenyl-diphosphate synthase [geranylgeranyl-diphosphate specific]
MKDQRVIRNGIKVKIIGELQTLPKFLVRTIKETENFTSGFNNFRLNLAIGYGGSEEIINGIKKIAEDVLKGKISVNDINEESFRNYLYEPSLPDPDLILRTSGEERVSNFLLWQSAYSEFYFSEVNWPELKKIDFLRAIYSYQTRERRYGY